MTSRLVLLLQMALLWEAQADSHAVDFITQARAAMDAAKNASMTVNNGQEIPMEIAIIDHNANLVMFEQMPNSWLGSIDIAFKKARTARFFDMPTENIGALSQPGGSLFEIEESNGGLITFPGGQVLMSGDRVAGAIGVSGGTVEEDRIVAVAGKTAFEATPVVAPMQLTYEQSMAVLEAALRATRNIDSDVYSGHKVIMNVAVVDSGGNLMQFARQDEAWLGSVDIAIKKAKTAAYFCRTLGTSSLTANVRSGATLYRIGASNGGLITFPGGLALMSNGQCAGAIGVSGDSIARDEEVAQAGVDAFAAGTAWTGPPSDSYAFVNAGMTYDIPLAAALTAIQSGRTYVMNDAGINPMNIAITDNGGNLIAFTRMTRAWLGSADISIKKAVTSISFMMNSGAIGAISDPSLSGSTLYGIEMSNGGLISFPGGVPVIGGDGIVGGIGVSGGSVAHDHEVAEAVRDALTRRSEYADSEPLSLSAARSMISASMVKAAEIGQAFDYCVVDRFLNIVALERQDGAWRGSIDIACKKAKTAMMFSMATEQLGEMSTPRQDGDVSGASLYRIERSNNFIYPSNILPANSGHWGANEPGGLITFGGGVPIPGQNGVNIGGIGVSGSSVQDDIDVAQAGVATRTITCGQVRTYFREQACCNRPAREIAVPTWR